MGYGALRGVGNYGFSWSASMTSDNAHYLLFHTDGLNPQGSSSRANGFQLRCLQE